MWRSPSTVQADCVLSHCWMCEADDTILRHHDEYSAFSAGTPPVGEPRAAYV